MKRIVYLCIVLLLSSCASEKRQGDRKEQSNSNENFHIYLLLGQSNMAGRGKIEDIDTLKHPSVYMLDKNLNWVPAKNPIHFDKPGIAGTGLGLSFGKKMAEFDTGSTIGLIPCAIGGTSIIHWFADRYHEETKSYPYNEAIHRINIGKAKGTIKGVLWHQGESDCHSKDDIQSYAFHFLAFRDSLEKDLGLSNIPIVIGEIGHFFYEDNPLAEDLNDVFGKIALKDDCIGFVESDSLNHKGDKAHFDSDSYRKLGIRYANEMIRVQCKCEPDLPLVKN